MGWTQAQDRPRRLLENLLMATGEYASVAGRAALPSDLQAQMWDHYGVSQRHFETIDPQAQRQLAAFVPESMTIIAITPRTGLTGGSMKWIHL